MSDDAGPEQPTAEVGNAVGNAAADARAELCARIRPAMKASAWTATPAQQGDHSYQQACPADG